MIGRTSTDCGRVRTREAVANEGARDAGFAGVFANDDLVGDRLRFARADAARGADIVGAAMLLTLRPLVAGLVGEKVGGAPILLTLRVDEGPAVSGLVGDREVWPWAEGGRAMPLTLRALL